MNVQARVDLLGSVVVRKATRSAGVGWVVGISKREAETSESLLHPTYYGSAADALQEALGRAEALDGVGGPAKELLSLLGPNTGLCMEAGGLVGAARTLRHAREHAGLGKRALARLTGVSRSTIRDIEAGRRDPKWSTMMFLLANCR